ncbi:hypothetical protein [Streptomyces sp. NBC_00564]|uniref:hypothetical protein n=1 Tax=Streptomyces sp. NBC_00564 TaxID=2903663 RepID=UPI00352D5536|nr:hypothetical protein OG256_04500 [Streptomyces sp. NBC_00564]
MDGGREIWEYRRPDDRNSPLWDITQIGGAHPDYDRWSRFAGRVLDAFDLRQDPGHLEVKRSGDGDDVCLIELAAQFTGTSVG